MAVRSAAPRIGADPELFVSVFRHGRESAVFVDGVDQPSNCSIYRVEK